MAEELLLLSPAQIEAAANVGRLARLAERLVEERSWSSVDMLLTHATMDVVPLDELANAARAIDRALARIPEARSRRASVLQEIAAIRALAASAIAKRLKHDPLTVSEKELLRLSAELMMAAGEARQAGRLFERAGEDMRAADAYGATGDLEKMEACHGRLEQRRGQRQAASALTRKVETLIEAGERLAALVLMQNAPPELMQGSGLNNLFADLGKRLFRGRALTFIVRGHHKPGVRCAGLPAVLGRDPGCELPLRDPGVSRKHALILSDSGRMVIEDAGSRAGTTLGHARLVGRVPLASAMELGLGSVTKLRVETLGPQTKLTGLAGLDRGLLAFVGESPLLLQAAFAEAEGLVLHLDGSVARIERLASQGLRVAGHLVGLSCDLLAGDIIEVLDEHRHATLTLEVQP